MHPVVVRLFRLLRGGRRPGHVAAAIVLGALAGAVCGWNVSFALLVVAIIVVNGPLAAATAAFLVSVATTRAAANLMGSLGHFLLEKLGLGVIVESLGHGPIVSLLGWDDYCLVGSATTALCLSLPAAHALARRAAQTRDARSITASSADDIVRPYWIPLAAACAVLLVVLTPTLARRLVGEALLRQCSAAVGAPVTAESISYGLFSGELELTGVRVYGLHEPGRVALRIDRAKACVEPGLMLRGYFHCDEATLSGIVCDTPPAAALGYSASVEPTILREDDSAAKRTAPASQPIDAARLVRDWNDAQRRLAALGDLIGVVETAADLEAPHVATERLQAARRRALAPLDPLSGRTLSIVQVKRLKAEGLPAAWSLGDTASLELSALSSRAGGTARSTQLVVDAPEHRGRIVVDFRLTAAERRHDVTASWDQGAGASIVDARRAASAGIDVAYARLATVRGKGWISRDAIELPLTCDVRGVVPSAACPRFGELDGPVWREGIARLGGIRFDVSLRGRLNEAKLQVVPAAMVEQLKHQLRASGEHALVKAVEAGRLTVEPPTKLAAATVPVPAAPAGTEPKLAGPTIPEVAEALKPLEPAATKVTETKITQTKIAETKITVEEPVTPPVPTPMPTPTPITSPIQPITTPTPITTPISTPIPTPTPISTPVATPTPILTPSVPAAITEVKPTAPPAPGPSISNIPTASVPSVDAPKERTPPPGPSLELRQPTSVIETSALPGVVDWKPSKVEPPHVAAITPPPTPAAVPAAPPTPTTPPAAATPRVLTNMPPPAAAAPRPSETKIALPVDDAKPSIMARVGDWFGVDAAEPQARTAIVPPSSPEQTATASKPYFPRLRAMFADESQAGVADYATVSPPSSSLAPPTSSLAPPTSSLGPPTSSLPPPTSSLPPPIAQRSSAIPPDSRPAPTNVPETAQTPWYKRVFK